VLVAITQGSELGLSQPAPLPHSYGLVAALYALIERGQIMLS
jgi:hypothetical protein